jgi:hypothetical protein
MGDSPGSIPTFSKINMSLRVLMQKTCQGPSLHSTTHSRVGNGSGLASCGVPQSRSTCCRKQSACQQKHNEKRASTYYAGKRRIFNAVATIAHCAIDGKSSDIMASMAGCRILNETARKHIQLQRVQGHVSGGISEMPRLPRLRLEPSRCRHRRNRQAAEEMWPKSRTSTVDEATAVVNPEAVL